MASFTSILFWSFLVAVIKVAGYSAVAEKVNWVFQQIFGRSAYAKYIKDWKELRRAKAELSSVSAQDEFARWARLQRSIDKKQAEFDSLHSTRKRQAMTIEFALSIAVRAAVYIGLSWWGLWRGRSQLVEGLQVPVEFFGPLAKYLAVPYFEAGQMSVSVGLCLGVVAFKHVLDSVTA